MNVMPRMIVTRVLLIAALFVVFVGLMPAETQENATPLSKMKGFLLPNRQTALAETAPAPAADETTAATKSASVAESSDAAKTEKTADKPADKPTPAAQKKAAKADPNAPVFDFSERMIGSLSAPVKLKLFSSLTCVHCAHFATESLPILQKKYVDTGKLRITFMDFPLEERATVASLISKCLKNDRYFPFMNALYTSQLKWMMSHNLQNALEPYARMAGLTKEQMVACATDKNGLQKILNQKQMYISKYQIDATPMLIFETNVRIKKISGAPSEKKLEELMDALLAELEAEKKL